MALKDVKVIELKSTLSTSFCGMVFADFGATVLRIDNIGGNVPDDPLANGKKYIALNLNHKEGIQIFRKLCKDTDILLESYQVGVMESLGIGQDTLLQDNPRLIYARLRGFGQNGCYAKQTGRDINFIAIAGLLSLFGHLGDKPTCPPELIATFGSGGFMCILGILLALYERNYSGLGQIVDCNITNCSAYLGSWFYRSQHLPFWDQFRGKNFTNSGAPFYELYETKDGKYMSVAAVEPKFYKSLIKQLGFTNEDAPQNATPETLKQLFTEAFLRKTQREWCLIFDKVDACVSPVLSLSEAPKHPHNVDEGTFSECDGRFVPRPAPKLSRTPAKAQHLNVSPKGCEHTYEVLKRLSYTDEDILRLERAGCIQTTYSLCKL